MSKKIHAAVVIGRCCKSQDIYGMRFEERTRGHWVGDWAFSLPEATARREHYDQQTLDGSFAFTDSYPGCPHCGSSSIFLCPCGKVGCWDQASQRVECPWCSAAGELSGQIDSLMTHGDR